MTDITEREGTIANVLNERINEVFADNDLRNIRRRVIDIISTDYRIDNNPAKQEAIEIFSKCRDNVLITTISTYLTGIKIGRKNK